MNATKCLKSCRKRMDDTTFLTWCRHLEITDIARKKIENIRTSPPSRNVKSNGKNVIGKYPSRKMRMTIQFESKSVELPIVIEFENDPSVLEYYDQPPREKLLYKAKSGRRTAVFHTPDFFVLREDSAGWEECKTESELQKLAEEMPNRYVRDENGEWRCPPGEEMAARYGLYYRIRSSRELDWTYQRNMTFLQDYLDCDPNEIAIAGPSRDEVLKLVEDYPGITLTDLLASLEKAEADDVYFLIAFGEIYVDLYSEPLPDRDKARIFPGEQATHLLGEGRSKNFIETAKPISVESGAQFRWDGKLWSILNVGERSVAICDEDGKLATLRNDEFEKLLREGKLEAVSADGKTVPDEVQEKFISIRPKDYKEVLRRTQIVEATLAGKKVDTKESGRTIRRWVASYKTAERELGYGFLGLVPKHKDKGNRNQIPEAVRDLMHESIETDYKNKTQKSKYVVWAALRTTCEEKGLTPPSYKTFIKAIKRFRIEEIEEARKGPRAAYKHKEFHWRLEMTTPVHGDRPFEIGHIDHTQLGIELVHSRTGKKLGRPWLTIMVDAFTRSVLAIYLAFDPPSKRSCMMVIRECVKRHNRLPQTIVVDNGKEFQSIYFDALLARYEITKKNRPPAMPRFGSVCERIFGMEETRFINNLRGNTQMTKGNVREITKSFNPKNLATWDLVSLDKFIKEFSYERYDNLRHPALGESPREARERTLAMTGQRKHNQDLYDEVFHIFTCPSTRKGTARVQPGRGVKIHSLYYWDEALRGVEQEDVHVRYDPFNIGLAHAYVKGRWVKLKSEYFAVFNGRTEKEVRLASEERRAQCKENGRKYFGETAENLARFLRDVENEELFLIQRYKDEDCRKASENAAILTVVPPSHQQVPVRQLDKAAEAAEAVKCEIPEYTPKVLGAY